MSYVAVCTFYAAAASHTHNCTLSVLQVDAVRDSDAAAERQLHPDNIHRQPAEAGTRKLLSNRSEGWSMQSLLFLQTNAGHDPPGCMPIDVCGTQISFYKFWAQK